MKEMVSFDLNKVPDADEMTIVKDEEVLVDEDSCNEKENIDEPFVGQCFLTEEDAFIFYRSYARVRGFAIRKGRSDNERGERKRRDIVCHHEGKRKPKVIDNSKQQRNRGSKRCDCKAHIRIKLRRVDQSSPEQWQVTKFVKKHNHSLLSTHKMKEMGFFDSNKVSDADTMMMVEDEEIVVDEDSCSENENVDEPFVGQCFLMEEDAFIFYRNYARMKGFAIRKGRSDNTKGERKRRDIVCHYEGKSKPKVIDCSKQQRNRGSKRCECKAHMRIKLRRVNQISSEQWQVTKFVKKHNHALLLSTDKSMEVKDGVHMQLLDTKPAPATDTLMGQMIKSEENVFPSPLYNAYTVDAKKAKKTVDYTDPFVIRNLVQRIDSPKYGSVTKEIEDLFLLRKQVLMPFFKRFPSLRSDFMETNSVKEVPNANSGRDMVMLDDSVNRDTNAPCTDIIAIPDDDDEEPTLGRPFQPYRDIVLNKPEGEYSMKQFLEGDFSPGQYSGGRGGGFSGASAAGGGRSKGGGGRGRPKGTGKGKVGKEKEGESVEGGQTTTIVEPTNKEDKNVDTDVEVEKKHDKGEYVGVSDSDMEENDDANFDGLADIWNEMHVGLELTKDADMDLSLNNDEEDDKECDHSYIYREDIGQVCRVCGVIDKSVESIIEFQRPKAAKNTRTYHNEGKDRSLDTSGANLDGVKLPGSDFAVGDVSAHPRHKKQMKPHQIEGFNFLLNNLVCENPGGCILAHAPGSGKTFMLISFIQSFMAKYPDARPLVVLPKGILETWRKEFKRWQVEDIPLFDCYTTKADNRAQQFEVLKKWANQRSILLIGYKLFSTIVCDNDRGTISATCQEILLKVPSLLILDEGHTPRNQDTDQLTSLEKVETPRKVVLSGTLYQNHVQEVFNILNLVRPKFLRMEDSKTIKRRILSRVPMESRKTFAKRTTDNEFFELVEETLLKDENFKRKVTVINDLRAMTSKVLHYYKGDFLDELPGHMDFSVFLNLSPRQKREVHDLKKFTRKFKRSSDGSAIYVHPDLKSITKTTKDKSEDYIPKIDELLETLNEREGAKAKFYLNLLRLCSTTGEKLLVFCNYLIPLRFLMRLTMKLKGWSLNKEIFVITGDNDNEEREVAMEQFNNSENAKVFFGSTKACSEGISLVGASRIIIMDVHLNPSVTRQAIGRAFRPGQVRKLYTYRLIAANSPEEEDHVTCFRKESIAKMWFEWNEYCGHNEFEMETVDVKDCGDEFLETPWLNEDVTALFKRS